ncbi:hypothetical protein DXG03_003896 [Asterophora parasitica]|uniref:Tetratricopeptide repeat protein n=1 Tax=Asterophora parasitica TaxID=117018 RepID=A0A9P7G9D7_9AGAR|nr:hypothetical protein DXG03_003896 [Asterophora parasitica]
MSFAKSKLKLARDALAKKDYSTASDAASQVLEYEPENYNANVFFALSLLELGQYEKSEQTYLHATTLNSDNPLAWQVSSARTSSTTNVNEHQGLSKFYERRKEWEKYANTLRRLVDLYNTL